MFQIHLVGKGWSGRAVRLDTLTYTELEAAEVTAAREITKDSLNVEYSNKVIRLGIEMMIKEYSNPVAKDAVSTATWHKADPAELSLSMGKIFTAKDMATLKAVFSSEHSVSQADVDAILESKINVLAD
jgi:hypothetical protein